MKLIFLVEDDDRIRYLIHQYLKKESFQVEAFGSAEEVKTAAPKSWCDCRNGPVTNEIFGKAMRPCEHGLIATFIGL